MKKLNNCGRSVFETGSVVHNQQSKMTKNVRIWRKLETNVVRYEKSNNSGRSVFETGSRVHNQQSKITKNVRILKKLEEEVAGNEKSNISGRSVFETGIMVRNQQSKMTEKFEKFEIQEKLELNLSSMRSQNDSDRPVYETSSSVVLWFTTKH